MTSHNLIIIGSGPAGYTAATYAARAGFAPLVIAGSVTAGGALMTTTEVENFPGFPDGVQGPDLMEAMGKQAEKFGAEVIYDDVTSVDLTGDVKTVVTEYSGTFTAKAVIVSTGSAYRELGVPGEKELGGRGVSFCATCDGFFFKDKELIVVGGGDSAVEEALFLTRFATKVTLVVRRDTLRASKVMADRVLAHPSIDVVWNAEVTAIHGETAATGVTLRDTVTGDERPFDTSAVFIAIGHLPRSGLFTGQLDTDADGYILTAPHSAVSEARATATNIPGVFACGDVVDRVYRQAITAAGSGCKAALDAQHYLTEVA